MRPIVVLAVSFCGVAFAFSGAFGISLQVKKACQSDYFNHCSAYAVGSPGLRKCMRDVGERLSNPCLVALFEAGEITKDDIQRNQNKKSTSGGSAAAAPSAKKVKTRKPQIPRKSATQGKASKKSAKIQGNQKVAGWSQTNPKSKMAIKQKSTVKAAVPAVVSAEPATRFTHNLCQAVSLYGEAVTFRCRLDQKCCYTQLFDEKYCVPKSSSCF